VIGRGAGRWPTAESVMADVLEIARETEVRS
jgi:homoserine dehydrogenase